MLAGDLAHIFAHEFDHLDGVLWIDRLEDNRDIVEDDEGSTIWSNVPPDLLF